MARKPIEEIIAEASASRQQPFGGNLERYNVTPRRPTAKQRRSSGDMSSQEWHSQQQRDLQGGLRSLALKNYNKYDRGNPYLAEPLSFTGSSWPGGRERYLSRFTNPEALYRQDKEIYPQHMLDYWAKNPSKDPRNPENEELYERRYREGIQPYDLFLGNPYRPNYEGYDLGGGYEPFKAGMPVEGWNEYELDRQREEFGLGEFSGTEFPPRPLDYDADEFVDTPIERYQPDPGTGYNPMENIEYDALHMMNPYEAGEFVDEETLDDDARERSFFEKLFGF